LGGLSGVDRVASLVPNLGQSEGLPPGGLDFFGLHPPRIKNDSSKFCHVVAVMAFDPKIEKMTTRTKTMITGDIIARCLTQLILY
jgi:hypothetical protein